MKVSFVRFEVGGHRCGKLEIGNVSFVVIALFLLLGIFELMLILFCLLNPVRSGIVFMAI